MFKNPIACKTNKKHWTCHINILSLVELKSHTLKSHKLSN